jgi:Thoeris protein ThsB, TIR-like domain
MSSVTQKNPIRLFVCHVWVEDEDYHRIFEYVESSPNFFYRNTSTPDARPSGDKEALRDSLRKQIGEAEVVIVPAALYRRNVDWVEFQMHCAKAYDKPLIVLEPFGGTDTIPPAVQELADDVVPWDQRQLVDSIKRQARHEETTRFDVIEFKLD